MSKLDYPKRSAALFKPAPAQPSTSVRPDPARAEPVLCTPPRVYTTPKTRHGKHKDPEAHRKANRDAMRKKRATKRT